MSGLYIHIPFCAQACHYCDFHFSTSLQKKESLLNAIRKEISLRKDYLSDKNLETIYFGGGTPSILSGAEINSILEEVSHHFQISREAEITMEANPDDLTKEKVRDLKSTGINRFSIGIQSFHADDLKFMNRAHSAEEGESSVKRAQDAGFENITIDLIYGFPLLTNVKWKENMGRAFALGVPHLSCYSMTVEPKTALAHFVKTGKVKPMNEEQAAEQFMLLMKEAKQAGFIQYEISNFGKEGFFSKHNTSYWKGVHYIGIGPSAHSYDGGSRQWNVANNEIYLRKVEAGKDFFERETLSEKDKFNEYVMTGLRTMWGIDTSRQLAVGSWQSETINSYIRSGHIEKKGNILTLTGVGKLMADRIASELFI